MTVSEDANAAPALPRCSPAALRRGDPRWGTAAPALRWLLVEVPGPWGRHALRSSRLDPLVGTALTAHAGPGVRVSLIRRHGRYQPAQPLRWGWADSRPGLEELRWGTYDRAEELLDHAANAGAAGVRDPEPAYLVCTHGRHDACCAIAGRPVAAALTASRPGRTWECSHVGGDRFAANVVVLPHGLYYGGLTALTALDMIRAHERGQLDDRHLRGRSSLAAPVQAAQHFARERLGDTGISSLPPVSVQASAPDTWVVALAGAGGPVRVTVAARWSDPAPRLTCSARHPERARVYDLLELRTA